MEQRIGRRAALRGLAALAVTGAAGCAAEEPGRPSPAASSQQFDPARYTARNASITRADGRVVHVDYRFHGPLLYAPNPVDPRYQSLVVSVPVAIDGDPVHPDRAPIVFANAVNGYLASTVADATEVGAGTGAGAWRPGPGSTGSRAPASRPAADGRTVSIPHLALAEGLVVVEPGVRGRGIIGPDDRHDGAAPAAIVDLKAAVRYLRSNRDRLPGDTDRIVATGVSAGGGLAALLAASGDSGLYAGELAALGAAPVSDAVYAAGVWCPITDLEHADAAYEWCWGPNAAAVDVDPVVSRELTARFVADQRALGLPGPGDHGALTADVYADHLLRAYLRPAADRFLGALPAAERAAYLAANPRVVVRDGAAAFGWDDYRRHVGTRRRPAPAFDAFDLSLDINNLFGGGHQHARHITDYSQAHDTTGLAGAPLDADIARVTAQLNPMHHLAAANPRRARHWWIRQGTRDTDTSLTVTTNLAAAARALGDRVDHRMYWDAPHGANEDPADFLAWVRGLA